MRSKPKSASMVWFVIVTYRPDFITLKRLLSALTGYPVVVVDNTDKNQKSKIKNQKYISKIKYIKTNENLGYGGGANIGIRLALQQKAEWAVVLNQDLKVTPQAISLLARKLNKLQVGIAGPFAGGLDPQRWTTIIPSEQTDYITGSCIAIHRKVIERVEYFYEPYFLYYEEVDLCLQAKRQGFPLRWLPIRGIEHKESVGLGRGSYLHQYYLARNHLLFIERQASTPIKLYEFSRLPKTLFEHISRREWGALRGIRDYFLRRFGHM